MTTDSNLQLSSGHRHSGSTGTESDDSSWLYETVCLFSGNYVVRVRSLLFYWGALLSFVTGITLLYHGYMVGGSLVMTLTPCLLLYPLIRFLFGGKDSVGAVITTVVVEELMKGQIFKAIDGSSKRKGR
jgi:hypothetical protein